MDNLQSLINSPELKDYLFTLTDKVSHFMSGIHFADVRTAMTAGATSFALILAAEMGDKSQLVCMALAAKHRPVPVIMGALAAFALLNALAVAFGNVIAYWLPDYIIALAVAFLFGVFGIQALRTVIEDTDENIKEKSGHGIFFTTFLLITVAEFGDKTQLAVVALSSTNSPAGVWLGATCALGTTSALGVLAGHKLLQRIPLELLHKIGGVLFLLLAGFALAKTYQGYFGG